MKRHATNGGGRKSTGTQAVTRAFAILHAFGDATPEWGLADLSRELGLTKTTTFRLLSALQRLGMVARDGPLGAYRLGPAAIELGAVAQRASSLHRAAHAELEELARVSGEATSLEVLIGDEVLILDEAQGDHKLSPAPEVGTRWPAHAASTGKVLLAAARSTTQGGNRLTGLPRLARLTARTITSPARFAAELAKVARQGYATAIEELEDGYVAVGAPVRNHEGVVVAAISVSGPSIRFGQARIPRFAALVREAADRISRQLGAGGAKPAREAATRS